MAKKKVYLANAKRKTSIAKATLEAEGHGRITINHVPITVIPEPMLREKLAELVQLIGPEEIQDVDIAVTTVGGGRVSQISAARTAIARVVNEYKKNPVLRAHLHEYDRTLLSGDARHAEMKKFGGHGPRARRQKSYR
jgi:ribosomal protein S9